MPYPKQLTLDEDTSNRLKSYLNDEITRHLAERTDYIKDLKDWQRDYWAPAPTIQKKVPFVGASGIIIPLTAIAVESIHARIMMALWGVKPYCSVKFRALGADNERAFDRMINFELEHGVNIAKHAESSLLELEKFGTGVAKPGYKYLTKIAVRENDLTGVQEEIPVEIERGPCVDYTPIANYLQPYEALDSQTAPWVGEIHLETPFFVKQLEDSGYFLPGVLESLRSWWFNNTYGQETTREFKEGQDALEHTRPTWPKQMDWYEIWLAFDVNKDGKDEEIVVHYHRGANKIMSLVYNWNSDLRRPYRVGQYMRVEGRWKGIGICKQSAQFQKIITTIHRQRLDAGTIANMRMFKVHKLSGYGPNEPIFPGKMWFLDDMTHLEPIQAGEVYTSAFANEQAALLYEQQRLGVNELTAGMPQQGTPGTATDTTLRLQEGNKKIDSTQFNIKQWTDDIYRDTVLNLRQFGSKTLDFYVQTVEDGALAKKILTTAPLDVLKYGVLFELVTVGAQSNKSVDRQNWLQISQMTTQYITGMIQLAEIAFNPQMPQQVQLIAKKGMVSASIAFKQMLETYDIRDEDRITFLKMLEAIMPEMFQDDRQLSAGNGQAGPSGPGDIINLLQRSGVQTAVAGANPYGSRGVATA